MQTLKYKYRLYPNCEQVTKLRQIIGSNRFVWNYFLKQEIDEYASTKKFKFYNQNSKDLTAFKKTATWLNDTPSTSLQQTLRYLETALKQNFKRNTVRKGFPKFKKKRNFDGSFTLAMVNAKNFTKSGKFRIPKVGDVKVVMHRNLPSDFSTCQIKQDGHRWFVVCTVRKQAASLPVTGKMIGIDLNSKDFVLSNGIRFSIPKYLRDNQTQIKQLQRSLSKKQKGSKNRLKSQLKLRKVHQRIANQRLDYFHKLSKTLVTDYDIISFEDLNVAAIQKKYGHVIKDNAFAMIRKLTSYKAELYGKQTVVIDRYFPSSQLCSGCGAKEKMPLHKRTYLCSRCGLDMDRDLNAAININRAGTAQIGITLSNAFGNASGY